LEALVTGAHYLARQTGQTNMARAALSPIACSWSRIDRRTSNMENRAATEC
jgi:hypothetical protein